jgi:hypothetical protein
MLNAVLTLSLTPKNKADYEKGRVWWYYRGRSSDFTLTVKVPKKLKSGKYTLIGKIRALDYSVLFEADKVSTAYERINEVSLEGKVRRVSTNYNRFTDEIIVENSSLWRVVWDGSPVSKGEVVSVKGKFLKKGKDCWIAARSVEVKEDVVWMSNV